MKTLKFIWVGKLKSPFWRDAVAHYWKNLGRHYKLQELCVKDGAAKLDVAAKKKVEGERILSGISTQHTLVSLDEHGKLYTSRELAKLLRVLTEDANRTPCFVVGGAYGLSEDVLKNSRHTISLSPMTFTHEMARVVLMEQMFRAVSILKNLPYHHD